MPERHKGVGKRGALMTGRKLVRFAAGVAAWVLLAAPAHADKWSPWIEGGGFLSNERDRG